MYVKISISAQIELNMPSDIKHEFDNSQRTTLKIIFPFYTNNHKRWALIIYTDPPNLITTMPRALKTSESRHIIGLNMPDI